MGSILLRGFKKMGYLYSAKTNSFYPAVMQDDYERAGTWPDDLISLTNEVYLEFIGQAPTGMVRAAGDDGLPEWVPETPLDENMLIEQAELLKAALRMAADDALLPLNDAVDLGIATEEEKARFTLWRKYRVMLNRIDTSMAPDITWPEPPKN